MEDLKEIQDDLHVCMSLLEEAGKAFQNGSIEDMSANLAAMAPRLERAFYGIETIIDGEQEKAKLDTDAMRAALESSAEFWGVTVTNSNWPLISDGVVILRRSGVLEDKEQWLEAIAEPRFGLKATLPVVENTWITLTSSSAVSAQWAGVDREQCEAIFIAGGYSIRVNAERVSLLWEMTEFDRVDVSFEQQSLVFWRSDDPEPVAAMLYEGEKASSYEEDGKNRRPLGFG